MWTFWLELPVPVFVLILLVVEAFQPLLFSPPKTLGSQQGPPSLLGGWKGLSHLYGDFKGFPTIVLVLEHNIKVFVVVFRVFGGKNDADVLPTFTLFLFICNNDRPSECKTHKTPWQSGGTFWEAGVLDGEKRFL